MKTLSIAEARRDFCSLADDIFESGDSVIISRHGVPCLIVSKFTPEKTAETPEQKTVRCEDTPLFGMWADREDMANPREWIEKMRSERMKRLFQ